MATHTFRMEFHDEPATWVPVAEAAEVSVAARALAKGAPASEREDEGWSLALPHPEEDPTAVYLCLLYTSPSPRDS